MSDEELEQMAGRGYGISGLSSKDLEALIAEVRRLRALVKVAEWTESCCYYPFCPWCGDSTSYRQGKTGHTASCPAFTPTGEVK